MNAAPTLPVLLESFFTQRLMAQRQVSPHTIASYRDTFRLLLNFAQKQCGKSPSSLNLTDLNAPLISKFLDGLEKQRGTSVSSRNVRLTAIRSFFRFAAYEEPGQSAHIQRVLAIQNKRQARPMISFLIREENRGAAGGAGSAYLEWPSRPCAAAVGSADRSTFIGGNEPRSRGCGVGHRRTCAVPW
jgi:hypothetical protein